METEIIRALLARRRAIHANWEILLRLERPTSPLAHPDTLVYRVEGSLDEIFKELVRWTPRPQAAESPPVCRCGLNPWLAYVAAGRQALREALVEIQVATPGLTAVARDEALACLDQVLDAITRHEIEAFCSLCQFREGPPHDQAWLVPYRGWSLRPRGSAGSSYARATADPSFPR